MGFYDAVETPDSTASRRRGCQNRFHQKFLLTAPTPGDFLFTFKRSLDPLREPSPGARFSAAFKAAEGAAGYHPPIRLPAKPNVDSVKPKTAPNYAAEDGSWKRANAGIRL